MLKENRDDFTHSMVIILTVAQLITIIALIFLWVTFRQLKNNVDNYKDSLPLVNIAKSPSNFTLPVPSLSIPHPSPSPNLISSGSIVGITQKPEINEVIEVVPTPIPVRKPIETQPKTESTGKDRGFSLTLFTEFSRDSGIGFTSDRNQSTSSESMKYVIGNSGHSNPVFQERLSILEDTRTHSIASQASNLSGADSGSKRKSFHDYQNALHSFQHVDENMHAISNDKCAETDYADIDNDGNDDDDYKHLQRLQTMDIEMIDFDNTTPSFKEKRKRLSQILNDQIPETNDNQVSFVNSAYSDASMTSQTRAPLASEECSLASDAYNAIEENENDVCEDEVYENQEIVDKHRLSVKM